MTHYFAMMMNSFQPNRRERRLPLATLLIATALVVVLGSDYVFDGIVRSSVRSLSASALSSFSSARDAVSATAPFTSKKTLEAENKTLREQLSVTDEIATRLESVLEENEKLREMARLASDEETGITVPVISSFHTSPYGTFLIGAGRGRGVTRGSVVLTPGGYVLGVVTGVDETSASVKSVFSPDAQVDLLIRDIAFRAEGRGAGNARASVPRDAAVVLHDVVISPTYGSRPVGYVESIDTESSNAISNLFIRIPVNLDTLRFVYVVPLR